MEMLLEAGATVDLETKVNIAQLKISVTPSSPHIYIVISVSPNDNRTHTHTYTHALDGKRGVTPNLPAHIHTHIHT